MQRRAGTPSSRKENPNSIRKTHRDNAMRLVTYSRNHEERLGALLDQQVVDLQRAYQMYCLARQIPGSLAGRFTSTITLLAAGDEGIRTAVESLRFIQTKPAGRDTMEDVLFDLESVALRAQLAHPGKVICVGGNFPAPGKMSGPDYPILFLKPASTITGPGMPVPVSPVASNVAYEVELAVVIGKRAHNLAGQDVSGYIAGYVLANDMGDRLLEKRTSQWTTGDVRSFTPLGPAIVTDEITDTHDLQMQTWVNDPRSTGRTGGVLRR
jgi:acylpyruvate hydrolase